ncbi:hypothetical protein [Streptomyces virginiae]|uniref:Serine protease n=1 Tax=Streptomyces virginiae TaxID=1961 RepID=A0ABZ1T765_STRVG|nr:hypothetical protein [Streptomyces virginiae]WTB21210.1 hypothetical protein OG253_06770 [Streptomyces virginiae]
MNSVEHLRRRLPRVRRMLRTLPGFLGVGLGVADDSATPVWRVYVDGADDPPVRVRGRGVLPRRLLDDVPASLLGLPTRVVVARTTVPSASPPFITAGASIETNHNKGAGSLGCFARDSSGHPVLLSCAHVLFPGFKVIGDLAVYSPDYSSCCSSGVRVGRPHYDPKLKAQPTEGNEWVGGYREGQWTGGFNWIPARVRGPGGTNLPGHASETDCAMARLDPGVKFHNAWQVDVGGTVTTIPIKGAVTEGLGIGKGPPVGTLPSHEQYVRVYNAVNGRLRFGTMLSNTLSEPDVTDPDRIVFRLGISDPKDHGSGSKTNVNQFLILPRPSPIPGQSLSDSYHNGEELTFEGGDSGSVVINHENRVVAMIIRAGPIDEYFKLDRTAPEFAHIGNLGIATPIGPILERLQVEIPAVEEGWSGTAPSAGDRVHIFLDRLPSAVELAQRRGAAQLREQLRTSVLGRLLLGKIGQHRKEVRELLTSTRPVAAGWRAVQGPAFYHHCVQGVRTPGHSVPTVINGVSRAQLVDTMLPLLIRYAGPALRRDLERYGRVLTGALSPAETIQDVPAALARPRVRS